MNVKGKHHALSMKHVRRFPGFAALLPVLVWAAACIVYLLFTSDHLGGADSGELIGASFNWGVAHPPGYPLYITLAKIFSLLAPFENIIYTYNLFSTICFLFALAILYKGLRSIAIHPAAIAVGGSFFIFSAISLRWLTTAEVFALHLLICSLGITLTLLMLKAEKIVPASRWLGLVVGLGAANHHTIVFLFPGFFYVYGLYWWKLEDNRTRFRELGWLLLTFFVGFSFYLQPVLSSWFNETPVSCLGLSIHSYRDFTDLFLRKMYGTFSLASTGNDSLPLLFWLRRYIATGIFSGVGLTAYIGILAGLQLIVAVFTWRNTISRACLLWLFFSFFFFLLVDVNPGVEQDILTRMYLMPNMIASLLAVLAMDFILRKYAMHGRSGLVCSLAVFLFLAAGWNGMNRVNLSPLDVEMQFGRDILAGLQPDSLLFVNSDPSIFSTFYLQEVEGFRKDVVPVVWPMTGRRHYRSYLAARLGRKVGLSREAVPDGTGETLSVSAGIHSNEVSTAEWIMTLLKRGTAVYSMAAVDSLLGEESDPVKNLLVSSPQGILMRVTRSGEHAMTGEEMLQNNIQFIESCLQWMPVVDFSRLHTTETSIVRKYLEHLKFLRNYQFSIKTQVLSSSLLEKLCQVIQQKDVGDQFADFYLGLYYYRFKGDMALAGKYMQSFVMSYAGDQQDYLETARLTLKKTEPEQEQRALNP